MTLNFEYETLVVLFSVMEHRRETSSSIGRMPPDRQLTAFIQALFQPDDLVELRAIESAPSDSKTRGTITLREWLPAKELSDQFPKLQSVNEQGANIYFGVNPRVSRSGTKAAIHQSRVLWADLDRCTSVDAEQRWRDRVPEPTLIINSGHGVHLYWKLEQSVDVATAEKRTELELLLKALYRDLNSDSTQDVTRLLRLPGFFNTKSDPVFCTIERFSPRAVYSLSAFRAWKELARHEAVTLAPTLAEPSQENTQQVFARLKKDSIRLPASPDIRRIRGLVASLDRDVPDRSRRDFWVVCKLLELGLAPTDVHALVSGKSKFESEQYTQRTVQNALRALENQ